MSACHSGGSAASRLQLRGLAAGEFPLGDETGLPLIPCPECGLARVIERRSSKEATKNYLRVFFKCPRNGYPKLCGFYAFQRQYLEKLCELDIVRIRSSTMELEIAGAEEEAADATSGRAGMDLAEKLEAKKQTSNEAKLQAKMDNLMWKFNLLLICAIVVGSVFMYHVLLKNA